MRGALGDLLEALAGEQWPPVLVVTGEDQDGRERAIQAVVRAVPEEDRATTVERLSGRPVAQVLDAARTAPLWGDRRVVIVTDCEWLVPTADAGAQEDLTEYVRRAPRHALLALEAIKVDRRLTVVKAIEEHGFLLECAAPRERDMPFWLTERSRESGLALTAEAAQVLADAVGTDTGLAAREVDKLVLLAGERPARGFAPVDAELVEQSLGPARAAGAFALEDAILGGRGPAALETMDRRLAGADAGTPLILLGRLAAVVRRLSIAAGVLGRGGGEQEVQQALGGHPFVAHKYAVAARGLGSRTERAMAACVVADGMLKSGRNPRAALTKVVLALVGSEEV